MHKLSRLVLSLVSLALPALTLTGCVYALRPANPPSQHVLRILAHAPQHYVLRVDKGPPHRVGFDGLISFAVPPLEPGCAVYLFGVVKVADHRAEDIPAIEIFRGGQVVRRLSLKDLHYLRLDSDNCRLLRLQ
jgi:hypothetical protein